MTRRNELAGFKFTRRQKKVYSILSEHPYGRIIGVQNKYKTLKLSIRSKENFTVYYVRPDVIKRMIRKQSLRVLSNGRYKVYLPGQLPAKQLNLYPNQQLTLL